MALFAVASLALWWAEGRGWSNGSFRVFFAFGAIVNVPWLALGTVYLLAGPRVGHTTLRGLLVFSGFAVGVVFTAPLHGTLDPGTLPKGSEHFDPLPRILAAVGSSVPALVIFGGADAINPPSPAALAAFGGQQLVIPEAGHLPHVEAARQVNGAITDFIKRVDG